MLSNHPGFQNEVQTVAGIKSMLSNPLQPSELGSKISTFQRNRNIRRNFITLNGNPAMSPLDALKQILSTQNLKSKQSKQRNEGKQFKSEAVRKTAHLKKVAQIKVEAVEDKKPKS